jgi:hypothetical protein
LLSLEKNAIKMNFLDDDDNDDVDNDNDQGDHDGNDGFKDHR